MSTERPGRRGRPPRCPRELALRIIGLRLQGLTYMEISAALNAEGIPTSMGRPLWGQVIR